MGKPSSMIHHFKESLALSHNCEDAPWWEPVYRKAFPGFLAMHSVRHDGWHQRAGIDRVIVLANSKVVLVDEKVRTKDYPDILLEIWSNEGECVPGWIEKPQACDYIAYAFIPSQQCFVLPFLQLRRAWLENRSQWIAQYPEIRAQNETYVTVSVGIPKAILFNAVRNAMFVEW